MPHAVTTRPADQAHRNNLVCSSFWLVPLTLACLTQPTLWGCSSEKGRAEKQVRPGGPPAATAPRGDVADIQRLTGVVHVSAPIVALRIEIQDATLYCSTGGALELRAAAISWEGTNRIICPGPDGAEEGHPGQDQRPWCVGEDRNNWANDFRDGGNARGGNGGPGDDGLPGGSVTLDTTYHLFHEGATLTIDNPGGRGRKGGRPGHGQQKSTAPSGDDCDHGTRLRNQHSAPDGDPGRAGDNGMPGNVTIKGRALTATIVFVNNQSTTIPAIGPQ